MAQVLLVRHGETDDNREPIRAQGFTDTPLNDTGRRQAAEAADQLAADRSARTLAVELGPLPRRRDSGDHRRSSSASSRAPTRGCGRATAAGGRASGSSTSSVAEPELYAAWRRVPVRTSGFRVASR